eukprot:239951-Chlamydomonas_euryale.AAC.1
MLGRTCARSCGIVGVWPLGTVRCTLALVGLAVAMPGLHLRMPGERGACNLLGPTESAYGVNKVWTIGV